MAEYLQIMYLIRNLHPKSIKKTLEAEFQNGNSFSKVAETISMKRCGCELGYEDTCITFFGGFHGVQVGTLCITLGVLECVL